MASPERGGKRKPARHTVRHPRRAPANAPDAQLPFLTAALPGVGGRIKDQPTDFLVEEIPAYSPCGHGPHVFFEIEKRGRPTVDVIAEIARHLRRHPRDIGYAGLKDARAVTRQMLSLEGADPAVLAELKLRGVRVLSTARHTNKLKLGHLRGNRFVIKLRGCAPGALTRAEAIVAELARRGVPNYFGPQRFGNRGDNHEAGWAIIRGDEDRALDILLGGPSPDDRPNIRTARRLFAQRRFGEAARQWPAAFQWQQRACRALARAKGNALKAWPAVDRSVKVFLIQAAQSDLFNRMVAERIATLDRLEIGDLAWRHANGACFLVEDAAREQPRCTALEISPTGPLFGERCTPAQAEPGRRESELLAACGVDGKRLAALGPLAPRGERRVLRVPLHAAAVAAGKDQVGPYVRVAFELPPGSYATAVTREISKQRGGGTFCRSGRRK